MLNNFIKLQETKKLERSREDIILAGVCGGLGEYLGWDSTFIRVGVIIFGLFFNIFAVIGYIIFIFLLPLQEKKIGQQSSFNRIKGANNFFNDIKNFSLNLIQAGKKYSQEKKDKKSKK